MPEYAKEVMLGVLGASVGLAGLLLVFCGFLFGQAASFPPAHTDDATIERYKNAARLALLPFLGAVAASVAVMVWFFYPDETFYRIIVAFFMLLLVATAVYGTVVIKSYL